MRDGIHGVRELKKSSRLFVVSISRELLKTENRAKSTSKSVVGLKRSKSKVFWLVSYSERLSEA